MEFLHALVVVGLTLAFSIWGTFRHNGKSALALAALAAYVWVIHGQT